MTTITGARSHPLADGLTDTVTMLRRDLKHLRRYPVMTLSGIVMPVLTLLLFVYIFGGALGETLGTGTSYVTYVVPGILVMAIGGGAAATSVGVSTDMLNGIVPRFRTMAISRASVLAGRVIGSILRTGVSLLLVMAVALLIGFRSDGDAAGWLGAAGLLLMMTVALTWLAVAFGLTAKSPEGANGSTLILQFGPFLSSAFVQPDTMSGAARWIVEHSPFTPIIDTLRGLLVGTAVATGTALLAVGWCVLIGVVGYVWSLRAYGRRPVR